MLYITEDRIVVKSAHSDVSACIIIPLGGPEDNVLINGIETTREELEQFQIAIVNFMNTGYFDQEG